MVLNCGHHEACLFRYRHRGITKKYCIACLFENSGIGEAGSEENRKFLEKNGQVPISEIKIEEKKNKSIKK